MSSPRSSTQVVYAPLDAFYDLNYTVLSDNYPEIFKQIIIDNPKEYIYRSSDIFSNWGDVDDVEFSKTLKKYRRQLTTISPSNHIVDHIRSQMVSYQATGGDVEVRVDIDVAGFHLSPQEKEVINTNFNIAFGRMIKVSLIELGAKGLTPTVLHSVYDRIYIPDIINWTEIHREALLRLKQFKPHIVYTQRRWIRSAKEIAEVRERVMGDPEISAKNKRDLFKDPYSILSDTLMGHLNIMWEPAYWWTGNTDYTSPILHSIFHVPLDEFFHQQ